MNYKMIFYTVGQVLLIEAVMLVLPVAVALIYAEWSGALALALTAVAALGAGLPPDEFVPVQDLQKANVVARKILRLDVRDAKMPPNPRTI